MKTKKILAVLIDGLGHDYVRPDTMPFVSEMTKHPMDTVLGFSIACHATILTGKYPNEHLRWFHYGLSPETSPFKGFHHIPEWLNQRLPYLPKKAFFKLYSRLKGNHSAFGYPYPNRLNTRFFPKLDAFEDSLPHEPNAFKHVPSIFDHMRQREIPWKVLGMVRSMRKMWSGTALVEKQIAEEPLDRYQLLYLLFGDIDILSHFHGQDAKAVSEKLGEIDRLIEKAYLQLGSSVELLVFSDHGHSRIERFVDIYDEIDLDLSGYFHIVDDMYFRIWAKSADELPALLEKTKAVPHLHVLSNNELRKYKVNMPDNRYGDIIAILDKGVSFNRTTWNNRSKQYVSEHGIRPEDYGQGNSAFLSTSLPIHQEGRLNLTDIFPLLQGELFGHGEGTKTSIAGVAGQGAAVLPES